MLIKDKLNWQFSLGDSLGVPLFGLEGRLASACGISKYEDITLRKVCDSLNEYCDLAANDRDFATHIIKEIGHARSVTCWDAAEVIISLPEEFQMKLFSDPKWITKMNAEYKKLHSSFHKCQEVKSLISKIRTVLDDETPTVGSVVIGDEE